MEQKNNNKFSIKQRPLPEQVHLSDYLEILKRRKWVVIIFFLIVVGVVSFKSCTTIPVYKSTAQIIIEKKPSHVINMQEVVPFSAGQEDYYQTQHNLLRSPDLVSKVIEDLDLTKVINGLDLTEEFTSSSKEDPNVVENRVIDWYLSSLEIEPVRDSRLVDISFFSTSPEMAAKVANVHASTFIEKGIEIQHEASRKALDWLNKQMSDQKKKLEASQRKISKYKKTHNIVPLERLQNVEAQDLIGINTTLVTTRAKRIEQETAYNQLKSFSVDNKKLFSLPEIVDNSVIKNFRGHLIDLKASRQEMSTVYGPKHPNMIEINSKIGQIEDGINGEVMILRSSIKAKMERALALERSIQNALDNQRRVALLQNEKIVGYDVLKRDLTSNERIYNTLLKQFKEISLTAALKNSNIRIVNKARVPQYPVRPRVYFNILLAIALSMVMGSGIAFFFDYMDKSVRTPDDIMTRLDMSVLGTLPYSKYITNSMKKSLLLENGNKNETLAQNYAFDTITSHLVTKHQYRRQGLPGKALIVESSTAGEGKTTVLINAAMKLASGGLRVLIVDTDLQRPSLHNVFNIKDEHKGLSNAVKKILSTNINKGTLESFSMDDLFFLIAMKKLSGELSVTTSAQDMQVVFEHGYLRHIQSKTNPDANRLGSMFLKAGIITERQLEGALEMSQSMGQPLGYILINAGFIAQEKLRGFLKLQMEGYLQKLFSWKKGSFSFQYDSVGSYRDEMISFVEDYSSIIEYLGKNAGSRFIEHEVMSNIITLDRQLLSLLPAGSHNEITGGAYYLILMEKLLYLLKRHFDIVLLDAPPILGVPISAALSSLTDGVIFVVKSGHLSVNLINEAKNRLSDADANIIGSVLNQVNPQKNNYSHYYSAS